jgi:hypothetical protein
MRSVSGSNGMAHQLLLVFLPLCQLAAEQADFAFAPIYQFAFLYQEHS